MCGVLCLLSIRGVTALAMLVQQFRLSKDRIRLEVSSRIALSLHENDGKGRQDNGKGSPG